MKSEDLAADLEILKNRHGFTLFATLLDPTAEVLKEVAWPGRVGILLGNEMTGLVAPWLDCCDRRVTIPMPPEVDSLNLGVAAGIFFYEMQKNHLGP